MTSSTPRTLYPCPRLINGLPNPREVEISSQLNDLSHKDLHTLVKERNIPLAKHSGKPTKAALVTALRNANLGLHPEPAAGGGGAGAAPPPPQPAAGSAPPAATPVTLPAVPATVINWDNINLDQFDITLPQGPEMRANLQVQFGNAVTPEAHPTWLLGLVDVRPDTVITIEDSRRLHRLHKAILDENFRALRTATPASAPGTAQAGQNHGQAGMASPAAYQPPTAPPAQPHGMATPAALHAHGTATPAALAAHGTATPAAYGTATPAAFPTSGTATPAASPTSGMATPAAFPTYGTASPACHPSTIPAWQIPPWFQHQQATATPGSLGTSTPVPIPAFAWANWPAGVINNSGFTLPSLEMHNTAINDALSTIATNYGESWKNLIERVDMHAYFVRCHAVRQLEALYLLERNLIPLNEYILWSTAVNREIHRICVNICYFPQLLQTTSDATLVAAQKSNRKDCKNISPGTSLPAGLGGATPLEKKARLDAANTSGLDPHHPLAPCFLHPNANPRHNNQKCRQQTLVSLRSPYWEGINPPAEHQQQYGAAPAQPGPAPRINGPVGQPPGGRGPQRGPGH